MRVVAVLRKPLEGTVAQNCLAHGVGVLNVDGCRIATSEEDAQAMERANTPGSGRMRQGGGIQGSGTFSRSNPTGALDTRQGRWPSNVILKEEVAEVLDAQSIAGGMHSAGSSRAASRVAGKTGMFPMDGDGHRFGDSGGASRFFKQVKK